MTPEKAVVARTAAVALAGTDHEILAGELRKSQLGHRWNRLEAIRLKLLCDTIGIEVRIATLPSSKRVCDGILMPRQGGTFVATIDPGEAPPGVPTAAAKAMQRHRIRFSVAHEIGHTHFFDRRPDVPSRPHPGTKDEETFCNRFASALLIPPEAIKTESFSIFSVKRISRACDVSMEAAARAMQRINPGTWMIRLNRTSGDITEHPRLQITKDGQGYGLRKIIRADLGRRSRVVRDAFRKGIAEGEERLDLWPWRKARVFVSAARSGNSDWMLVLVRPIE